MIPRAVYQIWVGPDQLPDEFAAYAGMWRRHHPGWDQSHPGECARLYRDWSEAP